MPFSTKIQIGSCCDIHIFEPQTHIHPGPAPLTLFLTASLQQLDRVVSGVSSVPRPVLGAAMIFYFDAGKPEVSLFRFRQLESSQKYFNRPGWQP
jgi:hypothetical protein